MAWVPDGQPSKCLSGLKSLKGALKIIEAFF